MKQADDVALQLAGLYGQAFGGKASGRFRVAAKLVAQIAGRRRLHDDDRQALGRALFELGYVLVDMDSYFVVLSGKTFANYRRANAEALGSQLGED